MLKAIHMKSGFAFLFTLLATLMAGAAHAEAAAPEPAPKPKVYALISAVGDQFTYVTLKRSVGSNILDNNRREVLRVADNALNRSVLRGLDKAIEQRDPTSVRILATLNALEMEGVRPLEREKVAMRKLLAALEKMPERSNWDTIIVVTPKFQFSGRKGMGTKLEGIGIYVNPLASGKISDSDGLDVNGSAGEDTVTPDGTPGKVSSRYVAPYNYTQTWVFDAKTLKVLESNARYDYVRVYDPDSTAIDVAKSMDPEKLAEIVANFIERSMARSVGEVLPTIEVGDIKPVANSEAKRKP